MMTDILAFITDDVAVKAMATATVSFVAWWLKKKFFSEEQRIKHETATIDLIQRLDAEHAKYIGTPAEGTPVRDNELLIARKNELNFLRQKAYSNLIGASLKIDEIEQLQKSDNPTYSMDLYKQFFNAFEKDEHGKIVLKKSPRKHGIVMVCMMPFFFLTSGISFLAGTGSEVSTIGSVVTLITSGLLFYVSIFTFKIGLEYMTLDKGTLKRNVVDVVSAPDSDGDGSD